MARYGSFTQAAKALYSNQPNVARVINLLEQELGCQLMIRTNRGIHLTEDGFKKFCQEYEKYMTAPCINGKSFRILMKQQVAKLKKGLQEGTMYTPFRYDGV